MGMSWMTITIMSADLEYIEYTKRARENSMIGVRNVQNDADVSYPMQTYNTEQRYSV